jgi:hypothetical protein
MGTKVYTSFTFSSAPGVGDRKRANDVEMTDEIRQSMEFWGCCRDRITNLESASMINFSRLREVATEIARHAAKASR